MRRYFIKLKINLLESIAHSMINQIKANSMHPLHQQDAYHESQQKPIYLIKETVGLAPGGA